VTKHHQLYRAFGWAPPAFAHLPLLVNADGTKLSKRTGDVHVERYAERGYEPEAMLNFLALLGWDYHGARRGEDGEKAEKELEEVFSLPELVEAFDIGGVTHRRAAVSLSKLDYINKMTLRRKATSPAPGEKGRDALVARFHADLRAEPSLASSPLVEDAAYVGRVFDMELERVTRLNELPLAAAIFFLDPDYSAEGPRAMMSKLKKDAYGELIDGVELTTADAVATVIEQLGGEGELTTQAAWDAIHATFDKLSYKKKDVTMSLRHALTGRPQGPTVAEIMSVLGRERSLARLGAAQAAAE
jgi:glutamyl-tRNA synthetase